MKHLFLPPELAVIAKEKGFNEDCLAYTRNNRREYTWSNISQQNFTPYPRIRDSQIIYLPLYQQIIDWFILNHKIKIILYPGSLTRSAEVCTGVECKEYNTWNEAIEESFKLIPDKKYESNS